MKPFFLKLHTFKNSILHVQHHFKQLKILDQKDLSRNNLFKKKNELKSSKNLQQFIHNVNNSKLANHIQAGSEVTLRNLSHT